MLVKIVTKQLAIANESTCQTADIRSTEKFIDWTDSSDRKWLVNHLHWAVNNGNVVLIRPANFES